MQRRLAQGGAGDVRVHVDDVGAEGDVDRAGDAGAVGGQHQAGVGVRAAEVVEVLAEGGAEAEAAFAARAGRRRRRRRPSRGPCRTGRRAAARRRPRSSCRRGPARSRGSPPSRSSRRPE